MELIKQSLWLDMNFFRIKDLSLGHRFYFISKKYFNLLKILFSDSAFFNFKGKLFYVYSISDIGTLQSSFVDIYTEIKQVIPKEDFASLADVGANIGQFAYSFSILYPKATVVSFEPDFNIFKKLEKNLNSKISAYNFGLGEEKSVLSFYKHPELSLMSSFQPYPNTNYKKEDILEIEVNTLDSVKHEFDFIKIDVEGFELSVLKGAKEKIKKAKYILIELSLDRQDKVTNLEVLSFIKLLEPKGKIISFGRPLGGAAQDALIKLR